MTNDPADTYTVSDPSLFFNEAVARLRVAASLLGRASDDPDEWGGDNGWAQQMVLDTIRDVANNLEAFEAACDAKAKADRGGAR